MLLDPVPVFCFVTGSLLLRLLGKKMGHVEGWARAWSNIGDVPSIAI